jgi:hypothetical protein
MSPKPAHDWVSTRIEAVVKTVRLGLISDESSAIRGPEIPRNCGIQSLKQKMLHRAVEWVIISLINFD